jgi:hypothetical protein
MVGYKKGETKAAQAQILKNQSVSPRSPIQMAAVRLYSAGKGRSVVAKALAPHMYPDIWYENPAKARSLAYKKVRAWEESQWFRDLVYDHTVARVDAQIPQILNGMAKRARRRVDAARLTLEVTGRHNPRGGEVQPAVVQVNFGGILPRPSTRPQIEDGEAVDGEVVEEE